MEHGSVRGDFWLTASVKKQKGRLYIPAEQFYRGYINVGDVQDRDYRVLGVKEPGFFCTWSNIFYVTQSLKIFRVTHPCNISCMEVRGEAGHIVDRGTGFLARFYPADMVRLYAELFGSGV
jgi:hypothetical protein